MASILRLVGTIWLTWLLRVSSGVSRGVTCRLAHHKSILWHILHHLCMMRVSKYLVDIMTILSLHLDLLKLLLYFYLLLLRREMLAAIANASRMVELLLSTVRPIVLNDEMLVVWIGILSWEEPGLSLSFSAIFDSLLWCWTFTLSEMLEILKPYYTSTIADGPLGYKVCLLVLMSQCLFKLHLLVHLLLLVC